MTCENCEKLKAELGEWLDTAMRTEACHIDEGGPRDGWWDTMALRSVMDIGDRLVELGLWERHPDGYGRRQFYRPIEKGEPK